MENSTLNDYNTYIAISVIYCLRSRDVVATSFGPLGCRYYCEYKDNYHHRGCKPGSNARAKWQANTTICTYHCIVLIICAGTPPNTTLSGNDFVTTAPAPTTTPLPRVMPLDSTNKCLQMKMH